MYSLILFDDVVRAVDLLAHEQGTSRSNLVNRILAEYVSLLTPEKRIQQIFDRALHIALADSSLQMQYQPSGNMFSLRSAIRYKYNPTIRYSVELTLNEGGYAGELRVVSRSQSQSLLAVLSRFFALWTQIERNRLAQRTHPLPQAELEDGRYRRELLITQDKELPDSEALGEAIGSYIHFFDKSMNLYFSNLDREDELIPILLEQYEEYLEKSSIVI